MIERVVPIINGRATSVRGREFHAIMDKLRTKDPRIGEVVPVGATGGTIKEVLDQGKETALLIYGGDGTVWHIWQALSEAAGGSETRRDRIALMHIAGGRVNVNFNEYGVRLDAREIAETLDHGQVTKVDLARATLVWEDQQVNPTSALISMGFGDCFSLVQNYEAARDFRGLGWLQKTFKDAPQKIASWQARQVHIKTPDMSLSERVALLEVMNGGRYVKFNVTDGTIFDGKLTTVVVPGASGVGNVTRVTLGFLMTQIGLRRANPLVKFYPVSQVNLDFEQGTSMHIDGEIDERRVKSAEIHCEPGAVTFLVPPKLVK